MFGLVVIGDKTSGGGRKEEEKGWMGCVKCSGLQGGAKAAQKVGKIWRRADRKQKRRVFVRRWQSAGEEKGRRATSKCSMTTPAVKIHTHTGGGRRRA